MCPHSTPGCRATCVFEAGYGWKKAVRDARTDRTLRYLDSPVNFINREIVPDLAKLCRDATKAVLAPAVRLNCFSDEPWEKYREFLMDDWGHIQFYDYTKNPYRMFKFLDGKMPKNYHLTFSLSESNKDWAVTLLGLGGSVAIVTEQHYGSDSPLKNWYTYQTRNGDQHDLIFLHQPGSVILLSPKGAANKDETGFVHRKADESSFA